MAAAPVTPKPEEQLPPAAAPAKPDPAVQRLEAELAQQRKTTQQIMERLGAQTPPPHTAPPPADKKELEKEFYKDPLARTADIARTVSEAVMQRSIQEMGPQFETLKQLARDKARANDPELFDKYVMEIEAQVASCAPNLQTNIHVWTSAFNVIKGQHMSEILDAERQKKPSGPAIRVSTDGGPSAPSKGAPAPSAAKLTEDEKMVARNLGLSEEQYQAGKDHLAKQSERGPSSWDPYITFDSRQKRKEQREQQRQRKPAA